jgi:hypothetical protein
MVRRIISHPLFVGVVSALVVKFLPDIFGKNWEIIMGFLYKHLWIGLWPIWIGLAATIMYLLIRFSVNVYKAYIGYQTFTKNIYDSLKKIEEDFKKEITDRKGGEDGIIEGILSREDIIRKEIAEWRDTLEKQIFDLRESTKKETYELQLSINKLILQDIDFEERVNYIVDQRIIKGKQRGISEDQKQQTK